MHIRTKTGVMIALMLGSLTCRAGISLPVIDQFSEDSKNAYVTDLKSNTFNLPNNNWRIKGSRWYPSPEAVEKFWTNDKSTKRAGNLYRKEERLKPGQAASVSLHYPEKAWKYTKCGIVVDGVSFTITQPSEGLYLGLKGKQYDLNRELINDGDITLTISRGAGKDKNTLYWYVSDEGLSMGGQTELENMPEEARFGLSFNIGYREVLKHVSFSDFRYGDLSPDERPAASIAELTIKSRLPPAASNKTKPLLENPEGPLTKKEAEKLVEWALNEPGQWSNHANRMLSGHRNLYRVYRVYDASGDVRILNHLMDIAEMALDSRNDRNEVIGSHKCLTGRKDGKWTGEVLPSWPHFSGWQVQDGEKYYYGDVGEDAAGVHYLAVAARAIAETPEVWNTKVDGSEQTYLDKAKLYVNEAIFTVETCIIPRYIEPETLEFVYQFRRNLPGVRTLDEGGYVPFNRYWHVPIAFLALCPAMEILDIESDKVGTYDRIAQISIDRWLKSMDYYEKDGLELFDYPYSYPSQTIFEKDPAVWNYMPEFFEGFPSEDLGHLGCDASQLYIFHVSPRVHVPEDVLRKLANTLLVNAPRDADDFMAYRLNGSGRGRNKTLATDTYFLTLFQPNLNKLFWDNPHQKEEPLAWETLFVKFFEYSNRER
ncbi:hypothetical protein [Pontiella sulfatireligans]|uniref:Uncharacterized protein n=1 Tax=Pontiella sulfatireligans TaxID=2750658 RepID=A0A6C2UF74_9BACT|nr:hypothetical protein [Pontiella sulfatireligans]VGO18177.1 hypothetical protein SCARR_00228 [Pontiella sulfatireligans]